MKNSKQTLGICTLEELQQIADILNSPQEENTGTIIVGGREIRLSHL